ncbi:MAG: antitoxin MazE family protein [Synergistaceae bacterium]|nr:antitoxin MazE family protein [Synergistaceae bacterium]
MRPVQIWTPDTRRLDGMTR